MRALFVFLGAAALVGRSRHLRFHAKVSRGQVILTGLEAYERSPNNYSKKSPTHAFYNINVLK